MFIQADSPESPGCRLIGRAPTLEWLRLSPSRPPSSTGRRSLNILRVVTGRVFLCVIRGSLTSPYILINSVETAAPF